MAIQFRCVTCNAKLSVASRKAGTISNCPRCSSPIKVPGEAIQIEHQSLEQPNLGRQSVEQQSLVPIENQVSIAKPKKLTATLMALAVCGLLMAIGLRSKEFFSTKPAVEAKLIAGGIKPVISNTSNPYQPMNRMNEVAYPVSVNMTTESPVKALDSKYQVAPISNLPDRFNSESEVDSRQSATNPNGTDSVQTESVQNRSVQTASVQDPEKLQTDSSKKKPDLLENYSTDDFLARLRDVPEIGIDKWTENTNSDRVFQLARQMNHPLEEFIPERPDLWGLPFRLGNNCVSSQDRASGLESYGALIKQYGNNFSSCLARFLQREDIEDMIPAAEQILQASAPDERSAMITLCAKETSSLAAAAIARRAIFDQKPLVRRAAIDALRGQKKSHYVQILSDAIRYPLEPVVENAANAIVSLDLKEMIPELRAALEEPDPTDPMPGTKQSDRLYVRELVRTNHLANCTLCHAPSKSDSDLVKGFVPRFYEEIPVQYYQSKRNFDRFIRADITYLKQDFSVSEYVENHDKWPSNQRFDYLVRTRELTDRERKEWHEESRDSTFVSAFKAPIIFALRRLNDTDHGDDVQAWKDNLAVDDFLVRNRIEVPRLLDDPSYLASHLTSNTPPTDPNTRSTDPNTRSADTNNTPTSKQSRVRTKRSS